MATRIKLKSSVVLNKAPLSTDLEIGELAINANVGSPGAFIKDTDDNIVKIAGSGVGETPTLQEVTDEGSVTTQDITANKFIGDGSELTNLPEGTPQNLQSVLEQGNVATLGATFGDQVDVNAPLIANRYIELSQGTGSAGGTEININAEDGEVTLYDTSPIGGTPKTVLWQLEKDGGLVAKSASLCDSKIVTEDVSATTSRLRVDLGNGSQSLLYVGEANGNALTVLALNTSPSSDVWAVGWDGKMYAKTYDLESLPALP